MSSEDRIRSMLSDLGKATLRGVKKCPKCGTFTGSRGLSCKNKYCDVIFKESGDRCKISTKACKLITNSIAQIFSVRIRGKGPDYRGFVQLPVVNATVQSDMTTVITQTSSLCFVDSCQKSFDTGVLQCHEEDNDKDKDLTSSMCQHVQAAYKCYSEAQSLPLKNSILSSLKVSNDMKQKIWLLATKSVGPLVQRISKNIMAVKCKASPKQPLGYLHIVFYSNKVKDKTEHKYFCECPDSADSKSDKNKEKSASESKTDENKSDKRCAHFYACICAFASDPKLSEEFDYYIHIDKNESDELRQQEKEQEQEQEIELQKQLEHEKQQPNLNLQHEADKMSEMDFINKIVTDFGPLDDHHLFILHDDTFNETQTFDGGRLPDIDSIPIDLNILPDGIGEEINTNSAYILPNNIDQVIDTNLGDSTFADLHTVNIVDQSINSGKFTINHDASGYLFNDEFTGQSYPVDQNIIVENLINDTKNTDSTIINSNSNNSNIKIVNDVALAKDKLISMKRKYEDKLDKSSSDIGTINSIVSDNDSSKTNVQNAKASQLNGIKRARRNPWIIKRRNNNQNKNNDDYSENINESNINISFTKWLASITERINQTMHFQFNGKPDPLVFHVPQVFFNCLRERISFGSKKKRLPNSITAFVRKDRVPLGTFTKYTWIITNIFHVKSIFETPIIPLEITRSFIQNSDGTYELYKRQETDIDHNFKKTDRNALIQPLELKTFLKVGYTSPNQREPTPFIIEWIPDLLPVSKIGEMRIRFEFDHKKNDPTDRQRMKATL
ncbi:uncharacterized protein C2orf42 [Microplitis demolitor]|uniref:uncharacterized protein C2orf42 n=1 Tax=Microplitis demolitor TaxID=69319 RepID=UPI0004CD0423|nr:uncharacterized protein C2orf42 [Microplitis demolitor]